MKNIFFFIYAPDDKNVLWYKDHILKTLQKISNLTHYNPFDGSIYDIYKYNKILLDNIKSAGKIDLFFSCATDLMILPETIETIKRMGIPTLNLSLDDLSRPDLAKTAKYFDYLWVVEPDAVDILKSYGGINPIYLPMAANPNIYRPYQEEKEIYDVIFVGFKNSSRPKYIYKLLDNNIDINVWGYGWKAIQQNDTAKKRAFKNPLNTIKYIFNSMKYSQGREGLYADMLNILYEPKPSNKVLSLIDKYVGGELNFEDMIKLYSQAKISLGFNERGNTYQFKNPSYIMRLRDFEAPMSGACHLMYRIPEMLKYFEEDKEMLFYSSFEELVEKIRFYTKPENDGLRKKIKENARKRALKDHTWENRFNELFKIIGI